MKARDVWNAAVAATKEHPLLAELVAAFCVGFVAGALVFG